MFYNLRKKFKLQKFNFFVRGIKSSNPVSTAEKSKLTIVSQVYPGDILMYLLALKSFTRFVPASRIIVVGDRLRDKDKKLLEEHIINIEIIDMQKVYFEGVPRGACWERLLTLLEHTKEQYTLQLDSDTLTFTKPVEVIEAIEKNRSFTLGTELGNKLVSFKEAAEFAKKNWPGNTHVQVLTEQAMSEFTGQYKYVRGCAGFAGFETGYEYMEMLSEFSHQMEELIGSDKWQEWGSEQVSSNFLIANTPQPLILPPVSYDFFKPGKNIETHKLTHFLGNYRFSEGVYLKKAKKIINELSS